MEPRISSTSRGSAGSFPPPSRPAAPVTPASAIPVPASSVRSEISLVAQGGGPGLSPGAWMSGSAIGPVTTVSGGSATGLRASSRSTSTAPWGGTSTSTSATACPMWSARTRRSPAGTLPSTYAPTLSASTKRLPPASNSSTIAYGRGTAAAARAPRTTPRTSPRGAVWAAAVGGANSTIIRAMRSPTTWLTCVSLGPICFSGPGSSLDPPRRVQATRGIRCAPCSFQDRLARPPSGMPAWRSGGARYGSDLPRPPPRSSHRPPM